jgi:hypothetical protein
MVLEGGACLKTYLGVDQIPKLFLQSYMDNLSIWRNLKRTRLIEVAGVLPITIGIGL